MAEFAEVLRQVKRLHNSCEGCALPDGSPCPLFDRDGITCSTSIFTAYYSKADIENFEASVMAWAEKTPEQPVYPTWREALTNMGFVKCEVTAYGVSNTLTIDEPIPAEIAEKLGIQPINGGTK